MFSSTVSASNSEKCWNTMPMPSLRAARGLATDGLAVPQHLALVGRHDAVDHLDQRRFAGAVLAEQRVDLAGLDLEIDVVVGEHARKLLADADELQDAGCFAFTCHISTIGHHPLIAAPTRVPTQTAPRPFSRARNAGASGDGRDVLARPPEHSLDAVKFGRPVASRPPTPVEWPAI